MLMNNDGGFVTDCSFYLSALLSNWNKLANIVHSRTDNSLLRNRVFAFVVTELISIERTTGIVKLVNCVTLFSLNLFLFYSRQ